MFKTIQPEVQEIKESMSTLVKKVLAFQQCDLEQRKELLEKKVQLSYSQSPCVLKAVERIQKAQENQEKIFIGGDYDADGISATTILYDTLKRLKMDVGYYIPNRFKEGYGLHPQIVEQAYQKGYKLIITVDNGVQAVAALEKARELGVEVIVTDHHEYEEQPDCSLLVHPRLMETQFQCISGAGVALQLALGLVGEINKHVALAAIATMGDVMELWKENRQIVRKGMAVINKGEVPQISALFDSFGFPKTEKDLAFQIVPKLNAVGRLQEIANPNTVVQYFMLEKEDEIKAFSKQMTKINNQRKEITLQMSVLAEKQIQDQEFIVLNDERYHEGIVGLLAGKLANKYMRPTLVFTQGESGYKGSGRSIPGFDMHSFLNDFEELTHFGGHEQAVGCTVHKDQFEQFQKKVQLRFSQECIETQPLPLACEVEADEINDRSFQEYRQLAPFGQGFKEVTFAIRGLKIKKTQWIKNRFLKIFFENGWEGICFEPKESFEIESCEIVFAELVQNSYGRSKEKFTFIIKNMV